MRARKYPSNEDDALKRIIQPRAKNTKDIDEYQLWASLALELLGKAALARIHPSLIADPNHQISLFAASGVLPALSEEAIFAKSRVYIHRALTVAGEHLSRNHRLKRVLRADSGQTGEDVVALSRVGFGSCAAALPGRPAPPRKDRTWSGPVPRCGAVE